MFRATVVRIRAFSAFFIKPVAPHGASRVAVEVVS
jgi:hypothetical protein